MYFDSALNGHCEACLIGRGFSFQNNLRERKLQRLSCILLYHGEGALDIFPGNCRSALWTKDHEVPSFFHLLHLGDQMAIAPSMDAFKKKLKIHLVLASKLKPFCKFYGDGWLVWRFLDSVFCF